MFNNLEGENAPQVIYAPFKILDSNIGYSTPCLNIENVKSCKLKIISLKKGETSNPTVGL